MRGRTILALATGMALVTSFGLAACGGGDDTTGTLTKSEYIAEADKICDELRAAVEEKQQAFESSDDQSEAAAADFFDEFADVGSQSVDELEALPRPSGDEQTLEDFLAATQEQVDTLSELADAVRAGDEAEVARLTQEGQEKDAAVSQMASDYGFQSCGNQNW